MRVLLRSQLKRRPPSPCPLPLGERVLTARIMQERWLVYRATGAGKMQTLEVAACRFHY
jgi:hypothetical protein